MEKVRAASSRYVCLEGGDGSGKTTLAQAIYERLGSEQAVLARFPSDGIVGSLIRQGLMGDVALENNTFLYLFGADAIQQERWIADQLDVHGMHVICDRHPTLSGRVFQVDHHSQEQIEAVYRSATMDGVSLPDTLFVLDVPEDVAIKRMKSRTKYIDVVYEGHTPDRVRLIRNRYLDLAKRYNAHILDGTLPVHDLVEQIIAKAGLA